MKKKDEYSSVCKRCVDKNYEEFLDAKFELDDALEWLKFDQKHLDIAITEGEDVEERLEEFKQACKAIADIAMSFSFPEQAMDNHGCCEECENCDGEIPERNSAIHISAGMSPVIRQATL